MALRYSKSSLAAAATAWTMRKPTRLVLKLENLTSFSAFDSAQLSASSTVSSPSPSTRSSTPASYNLVQSSDDAQGSSRASSATTVDSATSLAELRVTDLTLAQIDLLIIELSDELVSRRRHVDELRNVFAKTRREWVVYIDELLVGLWSMEPLIEKLEGKCSAPTPAATLEKELAAWKLSKGKLMEQLTWAKKGWEMLGQGELRCAEHAVRTLEEKIEYLSKVREVVMLTDEFE